MHLNLWFGRVHTNQLEGTSAYLQVMALNEIVRDLELRNSGFHGEKNQLEDSKTLTRAICAHYIS